MAFDIHLPLSADRDAATVLCLTMRHQLTTRITCPLWAEPAFYLVCPAAGGLRSVRCSSRGDEHLFDPLHNGCWDDLVDNLDFSP